MDQQPLSFDVEGHLAEYQFFPAGRCCHAQLVVLGPLHLLVLITCSRQYLSIGFVQEIQRYLPKTGRDLVISGICAMGCQCALYCEYQTLYGS